MVKHFSCVENLLDFINNNGNMAVVVEINNHEYWLQKQDEEIKLEVYDDNHVMEDNDICSYDMIEGIFDEVKDGYFEVVEI